MGIVEPKRAEESVPEGEPPIKCMPEFNDLGPPTTAATLARKQGSPTIATNCGGARKPDDQPRRQAAEAAIVGAQALLF